MKKYIFVIYINNVIGTVMNDSNHGAFPLLWYVNQVHFRIFFCEQLISFFVVKYNFELGDFFENRYYLFFVVACSKCTHCKK